MLFEGRPHVHLVDAQHVFLQEVAPAEGHGAHRTLERLAHGVHTDVLVAVLLLAKAAVALWALIRPFSCVDAKVLNQGRAVGQHLAAGVAPHAVSFWRRPRARGGAAGATVAAFAATAAVDVVIRNGVFYAAISRLGAVGDGNSRFDEQAFIVTFRFLLDDEYHR